MVYLRFILRYKATCLSEDIFCHSSMISRSQSKLEPFLSVFCNFLSVWMMKVTSSSKPNALIDSSHPLRIERRLFRIAIFLAFLCLAIASAQNVLPRPPKASRNIPGSILSLLLTASDCHFLSVIDIPAHRLPDIMDNFFDVITHCPKQAQSCSGPDVLVMGFVELPKP